MSGKTDGCHKAATPHPPPTPVSVGVAGDYMGKTRLKESRTELLTPTTRLFSPPGPTLRAIHGPDTGGVHSG